MSAEFWNKLKHAQASIEALKATVDDLCDRMLVLEAHKPEPTRYIDIDSLAVIDTSEKHVQIPDTLIEPTEVVREAYVPGKPGDPVKRRGRPPKARDGE